jgi:ferredoxin
LVAIGGAIAARSPSLITLIGLPVLLIVLFRRRWFCRWMCPTGMLCEQVSRLGRSRRPKLARWPAVGQWILLITLAGACFGYPLLIWTDPVALLSAFFGLCWQPIEWAGLLAGLGLPVVLLISLLWPGAWCGRLCPLGAMQDLLALPGRVLSRRRSETSSGVGVPLARRSVLAIGLGTLGAMLAIRRTAAAALRPPGALDEARFTGVCIRCGNCIRTCPTQILHGDPGKHGLAGLLAPLIRFDANYCREDCRLCTQVCPSGAIRRLSLEAKLLAPIGLAVVDMDVCIINEATCGLCIQLCPYGAVDSGWDEANYMATIEIDAAKCPGCGACQVACPTEPIKAIVVQPCPPTASLPPEWPAD